MVTVRIVFPRGGSGGWLDHRVGIEAHRLDADPDQELGHVRVVRRRLSAQARVDPVAPAALHCQANHFLDTLVAFVVVERHDLAVTIDAESELGEVVGADREAVEALGEFIDRMTLFGISHIAYTFKPFSPRAGRGRPWSGEQDPPRPRGAEREHQNDVREPHLVATRRIARHSSAKPSA